MSEHDQDVPESTTYIDQSTVVPESMAAHLPGHDLPESAIQFDADHESDDGLPGGRADGLKKAHGARSGSKTLMIGISVVAIAVAAVGGLAVLKKRNLAQQQAAAAVMAEAAPSGVPSTVPAPVPAAAPAPSESAASSAPANAQQIPASANPPAPVAAGAGPVTVQPAGVGNGRQAQTPAAGHVGATAGEVPAVVPDLPPVAEAAGRKDKASAAQSAEIKASLAAEQAKNRDLEQRLAQLEVRLRKAAAPAPLAKPAQVAAPSESPVAAVAPAQASRPPKHAVAVHKRAHPAKGAAHTKGPASEPSLSSAPRISPEVLAQYRVTAVRNGVAWVETPTGLTAVRAGDDLDGIGTVGSVDEDRTRITVGGQVLQ